MNKFTFTLSDGQIFELSGPAGSTRAQAERIFLEQTAAGALVGLRSGDTRASARTTIVKFQLSREDRGTAGVNNLPVLAINSSGSISQLPDLRNVPVDNGITQADFLTGPSVSNSIGLLSTTVIQSLLAQTIKNVDQPSDQISQEKGIGIYGFTALLLEAAGYLKPGTCALFFNYPNNVEAWQLENPDNFIAIMSSPSIWTGKDGIYSLDDLLANRAVQDKIATNQIDTAYQDLITSGVVQPPIPGNTQVPVAEVQTSIGLVPYGLVGAGGAFGILNSGLAGANLALSGITSSVSLISMGIGQLVTAGGNIINIAESIGNLNVGAQLAGLVQGAARFGVNTVANWVVNAVPPEITIAVNEISRLGEYASQFGNLKLPGSTGLDTASLGGLTNQVVGEVGGAIGQALGEIQGLASDAISGIGDLASEAFSGITDFGGELLADIGSLDFLSGLSLPGFSIFGSIFFNKSSPVDAPAFSRTVNRQTLDVATNQIIGSPKILLPDFGTGALTQNILGTIFTAQQTLNSARNLGGTLQRLG